MRDKELEKRPSLTKAALAEVYEHFQNFLFFKTVKTGVRNCHCTACKSDFECGIHTLHRTYNAEWAAADSARHCDEIVCPICHKPVKVINTKLQNRKIKPFIEISQPVAFFNALSQNDVWIQCYFVNRTISADGKNIYDEQNVTNVYHLTPTGALYWKKYFSNCFGWDDGLCPMDKFREPFKWDSGLARYSFDYSFVYESDIKLNDTFLKYSQYEAFAKLAYNAGMIQYWCWYCDYPEIEMLVKLGHTEVVSQMLCNDTIMPRLLDWKAKKPWEFFKLTKGEYDEYCKLKYDRITLLKIYRALKLKNGDFEICREVLKLSWNNYGSTLKLARRIGKYNKTVSEALKYFEKISRNSAGACWHCPGITTREVVDMWIDYCNMGDNGKKNFNPWPSDLKGAHDNLLDAKQLKAAKKTAATLRKEWDSTIKKIEQKYPKVNEHCAMLKEKYEYDNGKYAFVCPRDVADVLIDGKVLNQCTARADAGGENWRYFERINRKETYIGFVRKSDSKDVPWFTIEFEPGGTVRQKRAYGDDQPANTTPLVTAFLVEWQKAIAPRLNKSDRRDAQKAKQERLVQFDELRRTKKTINYGTLAGTLLIEAFEKDLMELEIESA